MRLRAVAACFAVAAAVVTWLAVRDPGILVAGNAALLWAWAVIAWARGRREAATSGGGCRGCGRSGVGVLPDGSCAWCATRPRPPAAKGS